MKQGRHTGFFHCFTNVTFKAQLQIKHRNLVCISHLSPLHATAFSVLSFRNKHCSCIFVSDSSAPWMEKEWGKGGAIIWGLVMKHFSHLGIERASASWEGSVHCSSHWAAAWVWANLPPFEEMEALPVFCIPYVILLDVLFLLLSLCVYPWHNRAAQGTRQCVSPRAGASSCIGSGRVLCLVEGRHNQSFVTDSK